MLALCHERRNAMTYQGVFMIDETLLAELYKTAEIVLAKAAALPA